jgi:DNA polymerase III delta prime subunit
MLCQTFLEKYSPTTIDSLPYESKFTTILRNFIDINLLQLILVSDNTFSKNIVINSIINTMHIPKRNILFLSNFKDQGVSNIRSEIKLFSQIAKTNSNAKRMLIIEDIESYSDNIQKLFINNIDKWSKNINVIITCNNLYNMNESLTSRLLPITIPVVTKSTISTLIQNICEKENIRLSKDNIDLIITLSENNLLSVFHILQKCALLQETVSLDEEIIKISCTIINIEKIKGYFNLVKSKKINEGYNYLLEIVENGYSVIDILNELYLFVKITNILNEEEKYKCFKIISAYIVNFITVHEEELELLILTHDLTKIL